uniref:Heat shock protein family A (Hsp70) member 12B n=1 Tax=Equus asinus TaxID=9793 RepID=A0A9L0KBH2_EQUAS
MLTVPEVGLQGLYIGSSPEQSPVPSPPGSPRTQESCGIAPLTPSQSPKPEARTPQPAPFSVVVAIDFGTTSSGYAFSFASDPEAIHMMRFWGPAGGAVNRGVAAEVHQTGMITNALEELGCGRCPRGGQTGRRTLLGSWRDASGDQTQAGGRQLAAAC